jgi:hypothetical protein
MGTIEYRMGFISNLNWYAAGISLHQVTLAGFIDAGSAWYQSKESIKKSSWNISHGIELKNALRIGAVTFAHEIGLAWEQGGSKNPERYYRVRAVAPF